MLKRFYSKRSGFTLVEIVIAFAIFAIMASMVCQILDLSVKARQYNNEYQRALDTQEHLLTLIEKDEADYLETTGYINLNFKDGTTVELPYDRHSADVNAEADGEGLNYYISPVDYTLEGGGSAGAGADPSSGTNTGSQASRMDTRITGTGGISNIQIIYVMKDTHTYAPGDPMAIPAGHTRYFFLCSASSGSLPQTLQDEDVPYSQYRLYFYHQPDPAGTESKSSYLNMAASSVEYTDEDGKVYTKDVYKAAVITKVGYLKSFSTSNLQSNGLTSSNIMSTYDSSNNKYTIEQMGTNVVRIGSPYKKNNDVDGGLGNKGVRFQESKTSKFYVEFEGDPHLTVESFGYNATAGTVSGSAKYEACPSYTEKYNSDGTPAYDSDGTHVNIYGAFMYTRHYKD